MRQLFCLFFLLVSISTYGKTRHQKWSRKKKSFRAKVLGQKTKVAAFAPFRTIPLKTNPSALDYSLLETDESLDMTDDNSMGEQTSDVLEQTSDVLQGAGAAISKQARTIASVLSSIVPKLKSIGTDLKLAGSNMMRNIRAIPLLFVDDSTGDTCTESTLDCPCCYEGQCLDETQCAMPYFFVFIVTMAISVMITCCVAVVMYFFPAPAGKKKSKFDANEWKESHGPKFSLCEKSGQNRPDGPFTVDNPLPPMTPTDSPPRSPTSSAPRTPQTPCAGFDTPPLLGRMTLPAESASNAFPELLPDVQEEPNTGYSYDGQLSWDS